ncbi:MAG: hypothetical protein SFV55_24295 [Haliscomenobacter sp.]|uniref:hypothetical protein n=1 Tax=Haliscomenobacter sp. TaxID=2717303 RepID=UPI0029A81ABA|nr:hypothetical protein [Haliscomenobacter sp.]MDX2071573.1 hypothetical protein [Haliscomenobacter sp.]
MLFKRYFARLKLQQKIRSLSPDERTQILEASPYEAVPFQGEGYHVFLKSEPDFHKGYVNSLGEISPVEAEDWIIQQYLETKP